MGFSLTERQQQTLAALCETFHPRLEPDDGDQPEVFSNHALGSAVPARIEAHVRKLPADEQRVVVDFLDRLGTAGRGWRWGGPLAPFPDLPLNRRVAEVQRLLMSRNREVRAILRSLQRLTLQGTYVAGSRPGEPESTSLDGLYRSLGYVPRPRVAAVERLVPATLGLGQRQMACDYLVIGSGAAGAVMAAELAETGKSVLLVDAGELVSRSELGGAAPNAAGVYEHFGALDCGRNPVLVTTARTFGGGPVVNWGTCLDPPRQLLESWGRELGLGDGLSDDFEHSLFTVRRRLQVSEETSIVNPHNAHLQRGLERLGWRARRLERNAVDCDGCDQCEFGCAVGKRQDTRETYLRDAQRLGVYLLPGCRIERLVFSGDVATKAIGKVRSVAGSSDDVDMEIAFRTVVLCAGALQSPALLLRSQVRLPQLGRNLHLQPAAIVPGFCREPIRGWQGVVQSVASDQWANLDQQGYGVWLETAPVYPGLSAMVIPWRDPLQHKRSMQQLEHQANVLVLLRDRGGGQISLDARGRPQIDYRLAPQDAWHLATGVEAALQVHQAAGAAWAFLPTWNFQWIDFHPEGRELSVHDLRRITQQQLRGDRYKLFSAHQFSSCRMANTPAWGCVTRDGRLFGKRNVFVTDSSSLPTATGVNPMLTITTWSHFLAQRIKKLT